MYAELLSNIRQVSVVASLASASTPGTEAEVVDHGTAIRIRHGGRAETMTLPAPALRSMALPIPTEPSNQLGWRVPISDRVPKTSAFSLENQAIPWAAADLKPSSPIECRECGHAIVLEGSMDSWKDLPSENWAEMMEFWHCHKPHDGAPTDTEHLTKRGYGANNTISAQPGVGLVDLTSFMMSESDCHGIIVSNECTTSLRLPLCNSRRGQKKLASSVSKNHPMTWSSIQVPKNNPPAVPALCRQPTFSRILPLPNGFLALVTLKRLSPHFIMTARAAAVVRLWEAHLTSRVAQISWSRLIN